MAAFYNDPGRTPAALFLQLAHRQSEVEELFGRARSQL
jgi:hypothetical protein